MSRTHRRTLVKCEFFSWRIYLRQSVYYADGRGNNPDLGRHSLNTRDYDEALRYLPQLDKNRAISCGLADHSVLDDKSVANLSLENGRLLYEHHLNRPEVMGGPSAGTRKRYRAVFEKFIAFVRMRNLTSWNQITESVLSSYLKHLEDEDYAERTLYFEATSIKQIQKWLISEQHLPETSRLKSSLKKPTGTKRYCWTPEQVRAMIDRCEQYPNLHWLHAIIVALARTGMRIGELLNLRWTDVELGDEGGRIHIRNDPAGNSERRRTKNRCDRVIPIHEELRSILMNLTHGKDGIVFRGPCGGKLKSDDVRTAFVKHVIHPLKARFPTPPGEIGFEHGRLHSFRHYFVSQAANAGTPIKVLQEWIGHRDSEMIDHYYHLTDTESRRQMQALKFADEDEDSDQCRP